MLCDPHVRETVRARGEDPLLLIDAYVRLMNEALKDVPEDMTIAMHLCRGNYKGKWLAEGGYDFIADRLFNDIDVDAYFLEYDSPRAGDFNPLAHVPKNKTIILGLICSKIPQLESPALLRKRIEEASKYIPLDQLAISPQCGFASTVGGNPLTIEDEKRKLELLVRIAAEIWS
jgi:5-methyltetrahydropteroyltriglutamate--homocysteine methyltransferase